MKRFVAWALALALLPALALAEENAFAQFAGFYTFSSGAGAWSTEMTVYADGSFEGTFHDWDAVGEVGGVT